MLLSFFIFFFFNFSYVHLFFDCAVALLIRNFLKEEYGSIVENVQCSVSNESLLGSEVRTAKNYQGV